MITDKTLKQKRTVSIGIKRLFLAPSLTVAVVANSGIVLKADTVMVHSVLS